MAPQTKRQQFLGLIGWFVLSFTASAIGAVASVQAGAFYGQLAQPSWAPPSSVFGPVWTVLDRKSTRLNSRHYCAARMPSSAIKKKKQQHERTTVIDNSLNHTTAAKSDRQGTHRI